MSELSRRLADAKGNRSIDDIAAQAQRKGHRLDRSAVARYLKPVHSAPRPATVEALAAGFGVDPRELRMAAGLPPGELGTWEPPVESASLTQQQRDALDHLIRAFVRGDTNDMARQPEKMSELERRRAASAAQGEPVARASHRDDKSRGKLDADADAVGEESQDEGSTEPR